MIYDIINQQISEAPKTMKGSELVKKEIISLILAITMVVSLGCVANAAETKTATVAGSQNYANTDARAGQTADGSEDGNSILQDGIQYLIEDGQAKVYSCDGDAAGDITIPSSVNSCPVTVIADAAFAGCAEITSVSLPDTVCTIGDDAFSGCSKLATVRIPSGVVHIGANAFSDTLCFRIAYSDGVVYLDGWLLYVDADISGSFTVKEGTVGIAEMAARNCSSITSVIFPSSVKYINNQAFGSCTSLKSIIFQGDAPELEDDVFAGVTATVSYPTDNATWGTSTHQNYGGTLDWSSRFVDLPANAWYTVYALQAADLGLMGGVGNNLFAPADTTTRAMFVQILYAMEGKPSVGTANPFTDAPSNQWYADAVQWAYEESVTGGTSSTTFSPNQNVTREQVAVFLYAYYGRPEVTGDLSGFTDAGQVDSWAVEAMLWATQNGIMDGYLNGDGTWSLNPRGNANRAETATMMVAFYNLVNS